MEAKKTHDLKLTEIEIITLSEFLENIVEEAQFNGNNICHMVEMAKLYTKYRPYQLEESFNVVRTYSYVLQQISEYHQYLHEIQAKANALSNKF